MLMATFVFVPGCTGRPAHAETLEANGQLAVAEGRAPF
jgi:hypothetical protein